jgi:hypothetical protein
MTEPRANRANGHAHPAPPRVGDPDTPSHITDHAFVPKREWFSTCRICGMAAAAHKRTSIALEEAP